MKVDLRKSILTLREQARFQDGQIESILQKLEKSSSPERNRNVEKSLRLAVDKRDLTENQITVLQDAQRVIGTLLV